MCNKFVINLLQIYYIVKSISDRPKYFQITTLWHPGTEQLSSGQNETIWHSLLDVMPHQDDVIIFCNKIYYKVYYSELSQSGCVSLILDVRFTDWGHQQCFWASQTVLRSSYHRFWSVFDDFDLRGSKQLWQMLKIENVIKNIVHLRNFMTSAFRITKNYYQTPLELRDRRSRIIFFLSTKKIFLVERDLAL